MKSHIRAVTLLKRGEYVVPHMYLDTRGNVTIGAGQKLPSVHDAKDLPLVNRNTGMPATSLEIETDYKSVKKQKIGMHYFKYRQATTLELPPDEIDTLLDQRIKDFELALRRMFGSKWDTYPEDAQLGILDMIYTQGPTGLRSMFPKFVQAVRDEDWTGAAQECERNIAYERNEEVKTLFESAARQKSGEADLKKRP
jgi:GH24 family phage-related lysozyme (muramidase)